MVKKRLSKRKTLRQQHKIGRKAKEKERKIRKTMKGLSKKNRLKKDPGIPNLWPYKEQMLNQINKAREEAKDNKKSLKTMKQELYQEEMNKKRELAKLQYEAAREAAAFESRQELLGNNQDDGFGKTIKQQSLSNASKSTYYREFKKVVEQADVIIEVLDARDPEGCRARAVEQHIQSNHPDKQIVLVLNKIDLVPREVTEKWLTFLREELPAIAFRSATTTHHSQNLVIGFNDLMHLLKNYCRSEDISRRITVGIIGYPNVGKSSVINTLKRSKVAATGAKPGLTTNKQEIKLDKDITLLDCPGIIFNEDDQELNTSIILRNAVRVEQLDDCIVPVAAIMSRTNPARLCAQYSLPAHIDNVDDFLDALAKARGRLKPHGKPDRQAAARIVLQDWNQGKISFFTLPPSRDAFTGKVSETTTIIASDMDKELQSLPSIQ